MINNLPPDFFKNLNKFKKNMNQTLNIQREIASKLNEPSMNLQKTIRELQAVKPYINTVDIASIQRSIQPSLDAINNVTKYLIKNQQNIRNAVAITNKYSNFVEYVSSQYTEDELQSMELDEFFDIAESDDMLESYNNYLQSNKDEKIVDIIYKAHDDYINTLNKTLFAELVPNPNLQSMSQKLSASIDKVESNNAIQLIILNSEVIKRYIALQLLQNTMSQHLSFNIIFILFLVIDIALFNLDNNKDTDK